MTDSELKELLEQLNIPVAYDHFNKKISPPFMVYRELPNITLEADNKIYYKSKAHEIELVTDKKDVILEEQLETILQNFPYEKQEDEWDSDENIYHIFYKI